MASGWRGGDAQPKQSNQNPSPRDPRATGWKRHIHETSFRKSFEISKKSQQLRRPETQAAITRSQWHCNDAATSRLTKANSPMIVTVGRRGCLGNLDNHQQEQIEQW
jgi:hypothetical protein